MQLVSLENLDVLLSEYCLHIEVCSICTTRLIILDSKKSVLVTNMLPKIACQYCTVQEVAARYLVSELRNICFYCQPFKFYAKVLNKNTEVFVSTPNPSAEQEPRQRVHAVKDLIKQLPKPNQDTMQVLFRHLKR